MKFQAGILGLIGLMIFSLFFFNFSLWHFPELNSDHALHILMAEDFHFGKDWYYWGQNRLGSFLPFIAHLLTYLGLSAFNAVGIAQLLLLAGSLTALRVLIKNPWWFLAGAAVLALPIYPFWMQLSPGHPYLTQSFFLLLFLALLYADGISAQRKAWFLPFIFFLALWSSETSVAFLGALLLVYLKDILPAVKKHWLGLSLSSLVGVLFILVIKNQATKVAGYHQLFAAPDQVWLSLQKHLKEFDSLLRFSANKPFNARLFYFFTLLLLLNLGLGMTRKTRPSKISLVFLLTGVFSYFLIHLSGWNAQMGMPFRYYTFSWIFFALGLLLWSEAQIPKFFRIPLSIGLIASIGYAAWYFNSAFETGSEGRIRRQEAEMLISEIEKEVGDLNLVSVIGTYWNSHLIDALSPEITAIPHQGEQLRQGRLIAKNQARSRFLLIRNGWLDSFPDQIEQWGMLLQMDSQPVKYGELEYCWYRRIED